MHTLINTPKAMAAIGPYNQAIRVGNLVEGLDAQMHMTFANLRAVLHEAGAQFKDVVKFNIYLNDMANFEKMNDFMKQYLLGLPHPARTCTQPVAMPKGCLFLLDAIAVVEE